MNFVQGIGLDPNGRNLIEMFGFILKNDTAREVFGKAFGLIRIVFSYQKVVTDSGYESEENI